MVFHISVSFDQNNDIVRQAVFLKVFGLPATVCCFCWLLSTSLLFKAGKSPNAFPQIKRFR